MISQSYSQTHIADRYYDDLMMAYLERQHITGSQVDEQVEITQSIHVLVTCELMHVIIE